MIDLTLQGLRCKEGAESAFPPFMPYTTTKGLVRKLSLSIYPTILSIYLSIRLHYLFLLHSIPIYLMYLTSHSLILFLSLSPLFFPSSSLSFSISFSLSQFDGTLQCNFAETKVYCLILSLLELGRDQGSKRLTQNCEIFILV